MAEIMQIALWVFGFLHLFIDVYLCENIGVRGWLGVANMTKPVYMFIYKFEYMKNSQHTKCSLGYGMFG